MPDMTIGRHSEPTFEQIRQNFSGLDPSLGGKHLRLDTDRGLHLHDSGKLSGIGREAMERRAQKHEQAFKTVAEAIDRRLRLIEHDRPVRLGRGMEILHDVLGQRRFDDKLIRVDDLERIGARIEEIERQHRDGRIDQAVDSFAAQLEQHDPALVPALREALKALGGQFDLDALENLLKQDGDWQQTPARELGSLLQDLQTAQDSGAGPLQVLARHGLLREEYTDEIRRTTHTLLEVSDSEGFRHESLTGMPRDSLIGSGGSVKNENGFYHYTTIDKERFGSNGDKFHVSVKPEQVGAAWDRVLPIVLANPDVIKHCKITNMDEARASIAEMDRQIAELEKQAPSPARDHDLERLRHERNVTLRVMEGSQITLYYYEPKDDQGKGVSPQRFQEVMAQISEALQQGRFEPGERPESDLPVDDFLSFRNDVDDNGMPLRPEHPEYPRYLEQMKERPVYLAVSNPEAYEATRALQGLGERIGDGEIRGRRNEDGSVTLYGSDRQPSLINRLTGRIQDKRALARQEMENLLDRLEQSLGSQGAHPTTRQALERLRQDVQQGLDGTTLVQRVGDIARGLHDDHRDGLQQRWQEQARQETEARELRQSRGREVERMDGGRVGDSLGDLRQEIRDFDRSTLRPTRTVEKGVELDQTPDNPIWQARQRDEKVHATPLSREEVQDGFREPGPELLGPFTSTVDFLEISVQLHQALAGGDDGRREALLERLGESLAAQLRDTQSREGQLNLMIAEGDELIESLVHAIEDNWPPHELGEALRDFCRGVYDHAVSHLSDHMQEDGSVVIDGVVYTRERTLGEGAFGRVDRYVDDQGRAIVLKTPKLDGQRSNQELLGEARDEVRAHRAAEGEGHPLVVGFRGAVRGPDGLVRIALDEAPGGNLFNLNFAIEKAVQRGEISLQAATLVRITLFRDMLEGMRHVQEARGMVHLDLKSPNFLIGTGGIAKVGDFGTARQGLTHDLTKRLVDNPTWLAPEVIQGIDEMRGRRGGSYRVDEKVDTWSLGISAYELFHGGTTPFPEERFMSDAEQHLLDFIAKPDERVRGRDLVPDPDTGEPKPRGLGVTALDRLLNQLLHPDPAQRPGLGQILEGSLFQEPGVGSEEVRELIMAIATGDGNRARELSKELGV